MYHFDNHPNCQLYADDLPVIPLRQKASNCVVKVLLSIEKIVAKKSADLGVRNTTGLEWCFGFAQTTKSITSHSLQ